MEFHGLLFDSCATYPQLNALRCNSYVYSKLHMLMKVLLSFFIHARKSKVIHQAHKLAGSKYGPGVNENENANHMLWACRCDRESFLLFTMNAFKQM